MREKYFNTIPAITAERLVLATEAYQKFAGEVPPVFRAKIVKYVMEHMTTLIMEDELIVGTPTNEYRGANLFPEYTSSSWLIADIDEFPVRKTDPYRISPEDRETILETLKYWRERLSKIWPLKFFRTISKMPDRRISSPWAAETVFPERRRRIIRNSSRSASELHGGMPRKHRAREGRH